jgi:hypothetical protein
MLYVWTLNCFATKLHKKQGADVISVLLLDTRHRDTKIRIRKRKNNRPKIVISQHTDTFHSDTKRTEFSYRTEKGMGTVYWRRNFLQSSHLESRKVATWQTDRQPVLRVLLPESEFTRVPRRMERRKLDTSRATLFSCSQDNSDTCPKMHSGASVLQKASLNRP